MGSPGPKETRDVVNEYIRECLDRQIYAIRIVHGKGKGVQRRIVQALLDEHP
ncbi:DNA mismatch repair protein MutS, partial [candidate division GN15 bacterium]|nr:DNA mismatch repair protein MutS [candidate division GN15 bacterium]